MAVSVLIVMGVSGSGKTTIGKALAKRLGRVFADADSFHPKANIEKMRAGLPLDDADREPWLHAIGEWIRDRLCSGEGGVVTCSALKQRYRKSLTMGSPAIKFVYLKGSIDLIRQRLRQRTDHFMSESLLESQFEALEDPETSGNTIVVSIEPPPESIVQNILTQLVPH